MIWVLTHIGRSAFSFLASLGRIFFFLSNSLIHGLRPPYYFKQLFRQFFEIGYLSLPVVGFTALFTGMVLALQSYTGFARFNAEDAIASIVVISITRELGPVLGGLIVAGRIGASIAAEIGTMRVTEQIDALLSLSTNPQKYLIIPRFLAAIIVLPFLVIVADIIGVFGGYLISIYRLDFNSTLYLKQTFNFLKIEDVTSGLFKAAVFGFIIAFMGCYHGFNSKGGAEGVGKSTTQAVVSSSILILIANYFLTSILFEG